MALKLQEQVTVHWLVLTETAAHERGQDHLHFPVLPSHGFTCSCPLSPQVYDIHLGTQLALLLLSQEAGK